MRVCHRLLPWLAAVLLFSSVAAVEKPFAETYLLSYPRTYLSAYESSKDWDSGDWRKVAGYAVIGSALYLFDAEINAIVQRNRTALTNDLALGANQFGEGWHVVPVLGGVLLSGYVFDSAKTQDTALLSLKSFLIANSVTLSLKFLTQRERPFEDKGKQFWNGKGFNNKRESFPSGHTTIVWSIAPILAEQYKDTPWVAPTAYLVAAMTSLARMNDERHWASDVYTGALIGYMTAKTVLNTTPRLQVLPAPDLHGFNLIYRF